MPGGVAFTLTSFSAYRVLLPLAARTPGSRICGGRTPTRGPRQTTTCRRALSWRTDCALRLRGALLCEAKCSACGVFIVHAFRAAFVAQVCAHVCTCTCAWREHARVHGALPQGHRDSHFHRVAQASTLWGSSVDRAQRSVADESEAGDRLLSSSISAIRPPPPSPRPTLDSHCGLASRTTNTRSTEGYRPQAAALGGIDASGRTSLHPGAGPS